MFVFFVDPVGVQVTRYFAEVLNFWGWTLIVVPISFGTRKQHKVAFLPSNIQYLKTLFTTESPKGAIETNSIETLLWRDFKQAQVRSVNL